MSTSSRSRVPTPSHHSLSGPDVHHRATAPQDYGALVPYESPSRGAEHTAPPHGAPIAHFQHGQHHAVQHAAGSGSGRRLHERSMNELLSAPFDEVWGCAERAHEEVMPPGTRQALESLARTMRQQVSSALPTGSKLQLGYSSHRHDSQVSDPNQRQLEYRPHRQSRYNNNNHHNNHHNSSSPTYQGSDKGHGVAAAAGHMPEHASA